ncbi:uncharacterized protein LOC143282851 [Babylonia areolata]|uniref:uncharacterized protein LOC143282851 n=1 Tax=Babylonia areolata TaxID=304850 RepID=UPI003FD62D6D
MSTRRRMTLTTGNCDMVEHKHLDTNIPEKYKNTGKNCEMTVSKEESYKREFNNLMNSATTEQDVTAHPQDCESDSLGVAIRHKRGEPDGREEPEDVGPDEDRGPDAMNGVMPTGLPMAFQSLFWAFLVAEICANKHKRNAEADPSEQVVHSSTTDQHQPSKACPMTSVATMTEGSGPLEATTQGDLLRYSGPVSTGPEGETMGQTGGWDSPSTYSGEDIDDISQLIDVSSMDGQIPFSMSTRPHTAVRSLSLLPGRLDNATTTRILWLQQFWMTFLRQAQITIANLEHSTVPIFVVWQELGQHRTGIIYIGGVPLRQVTNLASLGTEGRNVVVCMVILTIHLLPGHGPGVPSEVLVCTPGPRVMGRRAGNGFDSEFLSRAGDRAVQVHASQRGSGKSFGTAAHIPVLRECHDDQHRKVICCPKGAIQRRDRSFPHPPPPSPSLPPPPPTHDSMGEVTSLEAATAEDTATTNVKPDQPVNSMTRQGEGSSPHDKLTGSAERPSQAGPVTAGPEEETVGQTCVTDGPPADSGEDKGQTNKGSDSSGQQNGRKDDPGNNQNPSARGTTGGASGGGHSGNSGNGGGRDNGDDERKDKKTSQKSEEKEDEEEEEEEAHQPDVENLQNNFGSGFLSDAAKGTFDDLPSNDDTQDAQVSGARCFASARGHLDLPGPTSRNPLKEDPPPADADITPSQAGRVPVQCTDDLLLQVVVEDDNPEGNDEVAGESDVTEAGAVRHPSSTQPVIDDDPGGNDDEDAVEGDVTEAGAVRHPSSTQPVNDDDPGGNDDEDAVEGDVTEAGAVHQPSSTQPVDDDDPGGNDDEDAVEGDVTEAGAVHQPSSTQPVDDDDPGGNDDDEGAVGGDVTKPQPQSGMPTHFRMRNVYVLRGVPTDEDGYQELPGTQNVGLPLLYLCHCCRLVMFQVLLLDCTHFVCYQCLQSSSPHCPRCQARVDQTVRIRFE